MVSFQIDNRLVGDKQPCFLIAEIGQNHQGDLDLAKRMILKAKECGADCVKFQKSNLDAKFTQAALNRPYLGPNSWGPTYGAHKEYLEFSMEQYSELQRYADQLDIMFTASAMDIVSLQQLHDLRVPFIKIGSGDANNIPLLRQAAALVNVPLVISTGMQDEEMIDRIVKIMDRSNRSNVVLMHCVSAYPTQPEMVGLRMINHFRNKFPGVCLGYSGHEQGILISLAAVILGAKVIERHFTLDPTLKGTDHKLSLTPDEFMTFTRKVRLIEGLHKVNTANGKFKDEEVLKILNQVYELSAADANDVLKALKPQYERRVLSCELKCSDKLGKSLVYVADLKRGHVLREKDVCFKVSYPKGLLENDFENIFGSTLARDVASEEPVLWNELSK